MVAIGFVFGAIAFGDGWHAKGERSTSSANVDSDRRVRAQEALRLIDSQPLLGVGPGRYTIALESVRHDDLLPAHNIVLHEGAEGGVLAGILTGVLLIALAVYVFREGVETTAVFLLPALFLVLDAYPYVFPTGLGVSALWLGVLFTARPQLTDD
jgi:O-antigen ligase